MATKGSGLTTGEMLGLIFTALIGMASMVAYAHNTFQTKEQGARDDARMIRIEQLQIEMMRSFQIPIPPVKVPSATQNQ